MLETPFDFDYIYEEGNYETQFKVNINGKEYLQSKIWEIRTSRKAFADNNPTFGNAMVGQIDLTIENPGIEIPRSASIKPYTRIVSKDLGIASGWIQKGEFFIDTREEDSSDDIDLIVIQGFDAMRKAYRKYPSSTLVWDNTSPYTDEVVIEVVGFMFGVSSWLAQQYIDWDTMAILTNNRYLVNFPAQYTLAEVLGSIAAMYGGNFIMSDSGLLKLVRFADLPKETYYLINERGKRITFGGTRILLKRGV